MKQNSAWLKVLRICSVHTRDYARTFMHQSFHHSNTTIFNFSQQPILTTHHPSQLDKTYMASSRLKLEYVDYCMPMLHPILETLSSFRNLATASLIREEKTTNFLLHSIFPWSLIVILLSYLASKRQFWSCHSNNQSIASWISSARRFRVV